MSRESLGIEMHDSVITRVDLTQHALILRLDAYVHHSPGAPGVDPGTGWVQAAEIRVGGVTPPVRFPQLPAELLDCLLRLDEAQLSNILPADLRFSGRVELLLTFNSGEVVGLGGNWIKVRLLDAGRQVEPFGDQDSKC